MQLISRPHNQKLPLICALVLSSVFLLAAYAKLFYPSELLSHLDFWAGCFEILLVATLLIFRAYAGMWLFLALISASWGGYAFFWHQLNLPCDCLGSMITIPTTLSLSVDAAFFLISLFVAWKLKASIRLLGYTFLGACLAGLFGFSFAYLIYSGVN